MQVNSIVFPAPPASYNLQSIPLVVLTMKGKKRQRKIPCVCLNNSSFTKMMIYFHGNAEDLGILYETLWEMHISLRVIIIVPL